tara:strand:+ start:216 stop:617 length:402 start_codon:yes stop_codon:yes gene_type:complete
MSDRKWTWGHVLSYIYCSFAIYTDNEFDDTEKKEIFVALSEWLPDESRSSIYAMLQEAFDWFLEDMKASDKENDVVLNHIFGFTPQLKEKMDSDACQAIIHDLIRIGKADGNYDEREQKWAEVLAEELGVEAS